MKGEASSSGHSRREWMYLAERVFSHPRYALVIVAALVLCVFERFWFVIAPLTLFFTAELVLRIWLQKKKGWRDRNELMFLVLDALATLGLYFILLLPPGPYSNSMYLRLVRLLRGMYMLRMLRVFSFLTYETFIYSLPMALLTVALCVAAITVDSVLLFVAVALLIELGARFVAIGKVLPDGARKKGEYFFIALDFVATMALFQLLEGIPQVLVFLRLLRVMVMLNPLGSLILAISRVSQMHEVRKESGMLVSMLVLLLIFSGSLIYFVYPLMDITKTGVISEGDYTVLQVILFAFTWLIDPGSTPAHAYSPGLTLLTMLVAMTGVFFFALLVGLGTNVMAGLLRELSNSPLSARVHLLFSGDNEKSESILKVFGAMCSRMRRSYYSAWIFFDRKDRVVSGFGHWLNPRQTDEGSRGVLSRFKLSGVREMIFFHREYINPESIVDHHALVQEAQLKHMDVGVTLFNESGMTEELENIYLQTLGAESYNSSSVTARMLYQMHHCSYMPELGIEMLDAVEGETGIFTVSWTVVIKPGENGSRIHSGKSSTLLVNWATNIFNAGINVVAVRNQDGEFRLLSDLVNIKADFEVMDVVALGRDPSLWSGMMEQMLKQPEASIRDKVLKMFEWPETWDLNLLFIGWHEGLPSMIEEMAEKHHKLTVNVLNPSDLIDLEHQQKRLQATLGKVAEQSQCVLNVTMQPWGGFDMSVVTPLLKGCKVIMLYPTEVEGDVEDSLLEMWYHSLAKLLTARKQEVKWWTPPKLMILPRERANSESLLRSSEQYPLLKVDVGSPDSFHDVYMARKILSYARRSNDPRGFEQECKTYEFINLLLGDAVLVESEQSNRLLEHEDATWQEVYREGLRRGWVPLAYGLEPSQYAHRDLYRIVDELFPIKRVAVGAQLHLLAGTLIDEFEMPASTSMMLFCRRGILFKEDAAIEEPVEIQVEAQVESKVEIPAKVETEVETEVEAEIEEKNRELATSVLEGEIMQEIWPKDADSRLLRVLTRQVEGALSLLNESTENGLMKISEVLEKEAGTEVESDIMDALTELQNIDRVMQRLNNVRSCLDEWSQATKDQSTGEATWKEAVEQRYVMEEERRVLRDEL